jgi:hypothetical protein
VIGEGPVALELGLAQALLLPVRQALGKGGAGRERHASPVGRPGADQHLEQQGDVGIDGRRTGAQPGALPIHRRTTPAQACGISLKTARRARTSSPRLWSWVAVASKELGKLSCRCRICPWKSPTDEAKRLTSKPTSLREQQPAMAIEGGILDRLGSDRCAELLEARKAADLRAPPPRSPNRRRQRRRLRAATAMSRNRRPSVPP